MWKLKYAPWNSKMHKIELIKKAPEISLPVLVIWYNIGEGIFG